MRMSKACWQSFGDWLNAGAPGILPWLLFLALGPVWALVPLAQQAAEALGPWLLALLEARQRANLALPDDADTLHQDIQARPFTRAQAQRERATWAQWRLEAELLRLVRLVEAPTTLLHRSGWSEWEVRYWALVITLARIGQLHAVLARQPEGQPIPHLLTAAEIVWQRATQAEPAAA